MSIFSKVILWYLNPFEFSKPYQNAQGILTNVFVDVAVYGNLKEKRLYM